MIPCRIDLIQIDSGNAMLMPIGTVVEEINLSANT